MEKLIKIGSHLLALGFFVALMIVNVQVGFNGQVSAKAKTQEAYAGPCGRRGCNGDPVYCTSYTVVEVGGIRVIRDCDGDRSPVQ